jgi:hypothetical protein
MAIRDATPIVLTADERRALESWVRSGTLSGSIFLWVRQRRNHPFFGLATATRRFGARPPCQWPLRASSLPATMREMPAAIRQSAQMLSRNHTGGAFSDISHRWHET